jgi:hypothetical protein
MGDIMHTQLRRLAAIAALTIGATACSIPAVAQYQERHDSTAQTQENHPDYSKNKFYVMGNKEGYQDHQRNKQRPSHTHRYKSDNDRQAHDYGYQEGYQGRSYRDPR